PVLLEQVPQARRWDQQFLRQAGKEQDLRLAVVVVKVEEDRGEQNDSVDRQIHRMRGREPGGAHYLDETLPSGQRQKAEAGGEQQQRGVGRPLLLVEVEFVEVGILLAPEGIGQRVQVNCGINTR